jgi:hypothetical protein
VTARTVIDNALTALRSVSAPDDVARVMRTTADEIERAWQRAPLTAGLSGTLVARSELVNQIAGDRVLDPFRRALGSAPLRIKRGDVIHYRAVRFDGSVEENTAPAPEPREDDAEVQRQAEAVRGELAIQVTTSESIERALPAVVRKRPSPWAVWLWPLRWILGLVHRKTLAAWHTATRTLADTKRTLAALEDVTTQREARERAALEDYYNVLRVLCGGGPAGKDVREIEVAIPGLPDNIELVELMGGLRASADVDAVFIVERDALYAPSRDGQVRLGAAAEIIPELPALLARARALTLARRARDKLGAARAEVDAEIERVEATFRERLHELGKLALPIDKAPFARVQLERVKPTIVASVNAVMEHASTHMGSELAQLGAAWLAKVDDAKGGDDLKAAIATIEDEWPSSAKRIAEEVRVLVMGGAGGVARDLYSETVSVLRPHGLPEEHLRTPKRAPEVQPVKILASLAAPTTFTLGQKWLAGLFKSFDTRKADLRQKVEARIEHIREVAAAEMLDTEPKLHAAVAHALAAQLDTALEAQQAWHRQAMLDEQAAIDKDRRALAPAIAAREDIARAALQLGQAAARLEAEQPAVAAAAFAAAS